MNAFQNEATTIKPIGYERSFQRKQAAQHRSIPNVAAGVHIVPYHHTETLLRILLHSPPSPSPASLDTTHDELYDSNHWSPHVASQRFNATYASVSQGSRLGRQKKLLEMMLVEAELIELVSTRLKTLYSARPAVREGPAALPKARKGQLIYMTSYPAPQSLPAPSWCQPSRATGDTRHRCGHNLHQPRPTRVEDITAYQDLFGYA